MIRLKVTFYVPPSTFPPEVLSRVQTLANQITGNIQKEAPGTAIKLAPDGPIGVRGTSDDGDQMVVFVLAGPNEISTAVKKVIESLGSHWLNCGVSLEMSESCPDCGDGTLIRVNKRHECCDHCEQTFENRVTDLFLSGT